MEKCENYETILPFSCCPLIFSDSYEGGHRQMVVEESVVYLNM